MKLDFSSLEFWLWIIIINIIAFWIYYYDKKTAERGGYRIPEKVLFILALVGATPASFLGQKIFRHKTKKATFQIIFWFIVFIQIIYVTIKLMGFDLIK